MKTYKEFSLYLIRKGYIKTKEKSGEIEYTKKDKKVILYLTTNTVSGVLIESPLKWNSNKGIYLYPKNFMRFDYSLGIQDNLEKHKEYILTCHHRNLEEIEKYSVPINNPELLSIEVKEKNIHLKTDCLTGDCRLGDKVIRDIKMLF